jgi:hypothetical protein
MYIRTFAMILAAAAAASWGAVVVTADTLVLRDGRTVEGQLVGADRDTIEFRQDGGFLSSRTVRVPREDVRRIEIDDRGDFDRPSTRPDRSDRSDRSERSQRPGGLREREVWVPANRQWTDTGIDVQTGGVLYFTAHGGDIQWRRGSHTRANGDPEGGYSPRRPIPGRPIGALIAKIGEGSSDFIFIGEDEDGIRLRGAGRLYLGINDDNVSDNQGAYRVTVSY